MAQVHSQSEGENTRVFGIHDACNKRKEKELRNGACDRHYLTLCVLRGGEESAFIVKLKQHIENFAESSSL